MAIKREDIIENLFIEKIVNEAVGIGHIDTDKYGEEEKGKIVMLRYVLPGEVVKARVRWVEKDYIMAEPVEIVKPSPLRITPKCKYFSFCGGCDLQILPYEEQLKVKKQFVIEAFQRIGKIPNPQVQDVIPSPNQWYYRNTATFKVDPKRKKIGFFKKDTKYIVDIDECFIVDKRINEVLKDIRGQEKFPPHNFKVRVTNTGDITVNWIDTDKYEDKVVIEEVVAVGMKLRFRISPESFFQVNNSIIPIWLEKILELVKIDDQYPELVYDLYCGIGLITLFVALKVKRVIGVEISKRAVKDAIENAKLNDISNVEFIKGDVVEVLPKLDTADVMIIDPPRSGADKKVLLAIAERKPKKIIYSSCNVTTLARDVNILVSEGYDIETIIPLDMFPQTYHIETIVALVRKT